ncbi:MAG: xylulokinase [Spirochaetales bacterium]
MFLCVDLGTSACKACLVNERGELIVQERHPYRIPLAGSVAEIHPDDVWQVVAGTIRALLKNHPRSGITGAGISTLLGYVFLDTENRPVRPAILYLDTRAEEECREMNRQEDLQPLLPRTGRRITPELLAPLLQWIRKHEEEIFQRIHRIVGMKDYLVFRMTGELGTDFAHMNYTGLYDVENRRLEPELLSWVGIEEDMFPPCTYPFERAGTVQESASSETGIPPGTAVVRGSTDGTTAMYGGGITVPRTAVWMSGTTDVCMCLNARMIPDPRRILSQNTGMVQGTFAIGGATGLSGGTLLRMKKLFSLDVENLIPSISSIPPGAEGLMLFPGLTGERSPYWSATSRGAILGWGMEHSVLHFLRAWVESSAYRICRILQTLESSSVPIEALHMGGGGSVWDAVNQVRADIIGLPLRQVSQMEATILGVALFAAVGTGVFSSLEEGASQWIHIGREYSPDLEKTARYRELFLRYEELLNRLYENEQETVR